MRRLARVGVMVFGSALVAGCFSPLTTLPLPPDELGPAGASQLADCDSALQLGSYCGPDSRSSVVLPVPARDAGATPTERPAPAVGDRPTAPPAQVPAWFPIDVPAALPTALPTAVPTELPVALPTELPVALPTSAPVALPTQSPTDEPTLVPIVIPAELPTSVPTAAPTATPTLAPAPDDDGQPPEHGVDRDDDEDGGWKGDRPKNDKDKGKGKGRKGD